MVSFLLANEVALSRGQRVDAFLINGKFSLARSIFALTEYLQCERQECHYSLNFMQFIAQICE